jgi:uncharacterized protein DUF402
LAFAAGSIITVREVWDDQVWLHFPEVVVSDDEVLATVLRDGTPLAFPAHSGGPHPWSVQTHWEGTTVLKLRRRDDWYSVWKFFDADGGCQGWYVNFERPYVRCPDGIDIDDLELDLVVAPDGDHRWKDVEHLAARLDRDDRWWSPWDEWVPPVGR